VLKFVAFFEVRPEELNNFIETWKERLAKDVKVKIILPPHISAEPVNGITGFVVFESDDIRAASDFLSTYELAGAKVKLMPAWEDFALAKELANFREGKEKADTEWNKSSFQKIKNLGATKTLEILPLLDWHKSREDLKTELGVSYLIRTDEKTILFDLGENARQSDPSPLAHNMTMLGVRTNDFDTIVISHNHGDHVGGAKWAKDKTFSLTAHQTDLGNKTVYTPIPMTYPGLSAIHTENPTVISKGITTIGTISNYLFRTMDQMGPVQEQALAINVANKGIVIIVGCAHQTVPRILERTEALFDEPIYGLIGGLHLAVTGGPFKTMGIYMHEYIGTGKLPWEPITRKELQENIRLLKKRNIKVVGLSPHDSSETSIRAFHTAFPTEYVDVKVGQRINI
jgi:7,8-dihydropterin-6-yl-methyl-4-(beta-D-ribofuranosyl)aminobenzene 5'-phosphate synthase